MSINASLLALYSFFPLPQIPINKYFGITATSRKKKSRNKFYIDEIYLFVTKKIVFNLVGRPAAWIDRNIVDGMMNTFGAAAQVFSFSISGIQSGRVQNYAAYFLTGIIGLALLFIYVWIH